MGLRVDHGDVMARPIGHEHLLAIRGTTTPFGLESPPSSGIVVTTLCARTSMTLTVPPISAVTKAFLPSGLKAASRGRLPTRMVATTLRASAAITETVCEVSPVT